MIPTYNCANYLVETLKSVLAQDPGLEQMQIEVVDDCSIKDDPEAVVRELGQGRVSFFRQAQNVGLTTNFNTCIQRAKGEWVHILHGDDAVLPGFYSQMQQSIESEPNIGAAFCRCIFIDENNNWKHLSPLYRETAGIFPEFWKALAITNRITTPSIIVKRSVYEKLGGFNSQLRHTADWEMWTRIGVHYQLLFEPLPLAFYREHSASDTSRLVTTGANIIDTLSCINIFEHYLPSVLATELTNKAKEVIVIQALDKATVLFSKGDIQAAINQIREGLKCSTSSMVLRSFANFLVNNEPLFKLFVEMIVSSKDDILSSLTSPYQIDEYEEKLEVDLRDINLIIFPDWQLPEELVYENLKSIIEAVIKLSNQLNIALLIDSSNGSEEEINLMISDIIFQMFQENELDSTGEPTISFVNNLSDRKWRVLLNKLKARIVLKYQNNEAISKSGADQILSLNLKELKNILG
ncbi:glycosyltransferase [Nostoc sp. B(2019)]|nr:glycosyltransferase [Nostoc sp. B(2019)]